MSLLDLLFDSEHNNTDVFFCISSLAVWLHQTRIGLSLYDVAGQGHLRESVSNLILPSETVKITVFTISS